ncbi:type 4a pilus biogenesis protein PilO [bacterium]|nr:type 4a pilus biogenesis protein PilO [bacterium]MBT3729926.1 type 4a pilus biogenesis protein PilO [bacterium]MBT4894892.1 type 4a pilus biogenesis protein PilO [bacterium]
MIKLTFPALFIILSIGLFFMYVDPTYTSIKTTLADGDQFNEALDKSKELQQIRDRLLARYNTFLTNDINKLAKLLPDNVDNVRLVLDIDNIASKYGMRIKNVSVDREGSKASGVIGPSSKLHESVKLLFSITASYKDLISFVKDLESSLRIVDIREVSLTPLIIRDDKKDGEHIYEYVISLQTYWLK